MSNETGTRHKAAERTAKQAGTITIAVSERKNEITLYYKNLRYYVMRTDELLRRANEHIQLLEKQRELFDKYLEKLNQLELKNFFALKQAIHTIIKGKLIQRISEDLRKYSIELGKEATLLKIRLKELTFGVERETDLIIKDYAKLDLKRSKLIINNLSYDEIVEDVICRVLGYENTNSSGFILGWRILSKTSLLDSEIAMLTKRAQSFEKVICSDEAFYRTIFDEAKSKILKQELNNLQVIFNF